MPIKDIENHLERADARFERLMKIEAIQERRRLYQIVIKLNAGIIAVLCAISAIYNQF